MISEYLHIFNDDIIPSTDGQQTKFMCNHCQKEVVPNTSNKEDITFSCSCLDTVYSCNKEFFDSIK